MTPPSDLTSPQAPALPPLSYRLTSYLQDSGWPGPWMSHVRHTLYQCGRCGLQVRAMPDQLPIYHQCPIPLRRVFGIGLSKTGTTSLHFALKVLGYRSCHYRHSPVEKGGVAELAGSIVRPEHFGEKPPHDFNAGSDITVAAFFDELDERYPGSQFVYTTRELNGWLASICKAHYYADFWRGNRSEPVYESRRAGSEGEGEGDAGSGGGNESETGSDDGFRAACHARLYGEHPPRTFDRDYWTMKYLEHERRVLEYFESRRRKQDVLLMDICGQDGWKKLCGFLGVAVPRGPAVEEVDETGKATWKRGDVPPFPKGESSGYRWRKRVKAGEGEAEKAGDGGADAIGLRGEGELLEEIPAGLLE